MNGCIIESWFVRAMVKATTDMWGKGWDERNGGNVSLRLTESDLAPFSAELAEGRDRPLQTALPELAGQHYLVTGSGKFFRNTSLDPADTLGIVRVQPGGGAVRILWGYTDGAVPTSELSAHLLSHRARQAGGWADSRVIMHCHATNLLALSYLLPADSAVFTRALWEMSTECLVVFPAGIGVLPWLVPGTLEIGVATAGAMARHPLVLWPYHGVFGAGPTLDETFGLIDTAEKAAEVLVKVLSMGGPHHSMTTRNLQDLATGFGVIPFPEALAVDPWRQTCAKLS